MVKVGLNRSGRDLDKRSILDTLSAKPPPEGRIPIGDSGFYKTPDTIDPRDCANYPDSPWCGGNPLSRKFVDIDIGVDIHACGVDIDVRGTLGFTKLPTHGISYRKQGECRNEPPPPPPPDYTDIPKRADSSSSSNFNVARNGISDNTIVYAAIGIHSIGWDLLLDGCQDDGRKMTPRPDGRYANGGKLRCGMPGEKHKDFSGFTADTEIAIKYNLAFLTSNFTEEPCTDANGFPNTVPKYSGSTYTPSTVEEKWNRKDAAGTIVDISLTTFKVRYRRFLSGGIRETINSEQEAPPPYESYTEAYFVGSSIHLVYGRFGLIKQAFTQSFALEPEDPAFPGEGQFYNVELMDVVDPNKCPPTNPYAKNPPPPPPPDRECCMQCCTPASSQSQNLDLKEVLTILRRLDKNVGVFPVKVSIFDADETKEEAQAQIIDIASISQGITRIIERVEKISKIIGIDAFPLELPETLIERVDENIVEIVWDWITPDATVKINNVMGLLVYILKYQNAVNGQWMQKIHIKDTDATKEGDQSKDIVIPDMANAMRELLTLCLGIYKALGLCTDISIKNLTESATIKQEIVKALLTVKDIQQWLDYSTDEKHLEVPVQITAPEIKNIEITGNESEEERILLEQQKKQQQAQENDLEKFLQPSTTTITYEDWDGNKSLTDYILHLGTLIASSRGQR